MVNTLIVDPSEAFRHSLRQLLASRFRYMRIAEAPTRREAVLMAHAVRADLLFADVRLPDGSGLALAELIAPALPHARVCIVTSLDLPEYRFAAQASGAAHFLAKADSTSEQIAAVVEAALAFRPRALVIDSDSVRREATCANLRTRWPALMVFAAASGRTGLAMASAVRPEVVLLPLSLLQRAPGSLGTAIKALVPAPTVLAFGRIPQARLRTEALQAGADHGVDSPADLDDIMAAIVESATSRRASASRRAPVAV